VLNVVTNAVDAAGENGPGGQVEVATQFSADEGFASVIVNDTGPGIPPEEVKKLFSPFVSTKGGRGTGLGLPVSQKILGEHGGAVRVESEPGRGSRFILDLPAVLPGTGEHTRSE
jgi:signal transduction histidine kinase